MDPTVKPWGASREIGGGGVNPALRMRIDLAGHGIELIRGAVGCMEAEGQYAPAVCLAVESGAYRYAPCTLRREAPPL